MFLCLGEETCSKILLRLLLRVVEIIIIIITIIVFNPIVLECYQGVVPGQEPPGPVVSVLTARLQVEIIKAPVLQLLTEILNTNLAQSNPALLTD